MRCVCCFSALLRNRRSAQGDRHSGVSVSLQYGSESEDEPVAAGTPVRYDDPDLEGEGPGSGGDGSHPVFQLYDAVRRCRNNQGQLLSEPFMQLPSRREYPDYFQQIKNPIALQQIRQVPGHSTGVSGFAIGVQQFLRRYAQGLGGGLTSRPLLSTGRR